MENTKKIGYSILFLLIMLSCDGQKQINYYDTQLKEINNSNNIRKLKLNLYMYNGKVNISSDYTIQYAGTNEKIMTKNKGLILQDSIFSLKTNSLWSTDAIIKTASYQEVEKNILYKDVNNIYYNSTSRNNNSPYIILDLVSPEVKLLSGNYIRDKKNIYSYGGINCQKLEGVQINSFKTEKYMNSINGKSIYLGLDGESIFHNEVKLSIDDVKNLPIHEKIKDSLQKEYFSDR
ncbi:MULTISPECIES: DKNYY domain-containing protein [unclassified Chryseobacterium]|uniref:DKNYY domain-containing protein n=1 Tax=unclassified Chryseobacterium TaxID=2593645 RepID=UPI000E731A5A|nr:MULTISPECIES: DKNYY domain-containing protein [unclassified Chryseobacterium]RKE72115.1 DKNYY family protein [Chryseobacterium sp. AG363]WNI36328.1 DKNYY domain-containing protein [Chryseobacterium sp. SG20098]